MSFFQLYFLISAICTKYRSIILRLANIKECQGTAPRFPFQKAIVQFRHNLSVKFVLNAG